MTSSPETISRTPTARGAFWQQPIFKWAAVLLLVYLLIVAVSLIGGGFKQATGQRAEELFQFATNPFMGLIIGTVSTALIQSSSTVSSIIVGLVAGGLPVSTAVPMIMGANIGTTITNTIVSLGHMADDDEFERAFAAATIHDFFNLWSVVIFLPLESFTAKAPASSLVCQLQRPDGRRAEEVCSLNGQRIQAFRQSGELYEVSLPAAMLSPDTAAIEVRWIDQWR